MRTLYLYIFLLLGSFHLVEKCEATDEPIYVSLGGCCEVASQLRNHHLRKEAYPFDWLVTLSHEPFIKLLNDDFEFFWDENYVFHHPDYPHVIENSLYQCEFRHDDPSSITLSVMQHIEEIKPKYNRRIARFRNLRDYPGKVFFIRTSNDFQNNGPHYWSEECHEYITAKQAKELKEALDQFFPFLDFKLIIINHIETSFEEIKDIDGVIEFKICKGSRNHDYSQILHQLIFNGF